MSLPFLESSINGSLQGFQTQTGSWIQIGSFQMYYGSRSSNVWLHFDHCSTKHLDLDQVHLLFWQGELIVCHQADLFRLSLEGYSFHQVVIAGNSKFLFILRTEFVVSIELVLDLFTPRIRYVHNAQTSSSSSFSYLFCSLESFSIYES